MKYNKDQIKAIEYPLMPLMILAGAGTGKTTTIIARIAHLIDKCEIKSDSILLLTFSIEAASNLHNKLIDLVGNKALDVSASTFHSFAYKECLKYYNLLGYDRQPELVNDVDLLILLNSKVDEFPKFKSKLFRRNPIMVIQSLKKIYDNFRQNLFSELELSKILKKTLVEVEDSQDLLEAEQLFQRIDSLNMFPYYQNWKKHNNIIDTMFQNSNTIESAIVNEELIVIEPTSSILEEEFNYPEQKYNIITLASFSTVNTDDYITIYDKYNIPGYLIYRGYFYIFQPFEQDEDAPMFYRKTYTKDLINQLSLYSYLVIYSFNIKLSL